MCNGYYLFPDSVLKFIVLPPSSNDKFSFKLKKTSITPLRHIASFPEI